MRVGSASEVAGELVSVLCARELAVLEELTDRCGRRYGLVDYVGAPDADRVIVLMGSASGAAEEALPILDGAVRYDNDNLAGHLNLGDAYRLVQKYGDAKLPDLVHTLANCPKARSVSIHDRCKAVFGQRLP